MKAEWRNAKRRARFLAQDERRGCEVAWAKLLGIGIPGISPDGAQVLGNYEEAISATLLGHPKKVQ
jgi:hypothetical protein